MDFQNRPAPNQPSEGLRLLSYCALCNTHYNPLSARVLDENAEAHLIHLNCNNCGSSIVALVFTGGLGLSSVGLITDLTPEDVLRFRSADAVAVDDVLTLYRAFSTDTDILSQLL